MSQQLKAWPATMALDGVRSLIDSASWRSHPDPTRRAVNFGAALSPEESQRLLKIIMHSLQVRRHYELFQLLQDDVQYFIPHQLLLSAWGDFGAPNLKLDVISAIPEVRTSKLRDCGLDGMLQAQYVRWLANGRRPFLLVAGDADWPLRCASCTCALHQALAGMHCLLVHGVSDLRDNLDSLYILASSEQILRAGTDDERFRALLETIIGQVDSAYRRVASLKRRRKNVSASLPREERNLSTREVQVLRGVAQGLGNAEIARQLSISPHTVKNHMKRIMGKLGVANRTAAAAQFRAQS